MHIQKKRIEYLISNFQNIFFFTYEKDPLIAQDYGRSLGQCPNVLSSELCLFIKNQLNYW